MLKKILLIIITMTFSFYSLMAIEEDGKTMPTPPFIRKTMIYTFNEEGKMTGKEKEDESSQSEEIFLEVDSLLKEESRIQSKLASIRSLRSRGIESTHGRRDDVGIFLATNPLVFCCPCIIIPYCFSEVCCIKESEAQNLLNKEIEAKTRLKALDQQTQGLMRDIYLRTGRQHPKMRIPS